MNGNGKILAAFIAAVTLVVGLALGSMRSQLSAQEKFVDRQQYARDVARLENKIDQLLQFHLEDKRDGR